MIAEKLADEIRREAKAGSVEHNAFNSRPGANVCIWHFPDMPGCLPYVRSRVKSGPEQPKRGFSNL
jgi:hypothetical protein